MFNDYSKPLLKSRESGYNEAQKNWERPVTKMPQTLTKTCTDPRLTNDEVTAPAPRRRVTVSRQEAEGIRRILSSPQSPTKALRTAFAEYKDFADQNPGW